MVRHITSFTAVTLLAASLVACEKQGVTEQQKETKASEQAANARNEAEQKAQGAQATAERDIAAARADFAKAREDYMHSKRVDLEELDRKITDLEAKEKTAMGKTKADLDARLPAIRAQRDAFARHLQSMNNATPATWDGAKASLDKEWDSLKSTVDGAS
jgi:septal ring factor EnvC (AmiA/AmiB activator)